MENSILNIEASYFNTHSDTKPKEINLLTFLTDRSCIKLQDAIRSSGDDEIKKAKKAEAKCIAVSGTFFQRGESGLIKHTGLIAIDIDLQDNQEIINHPNFFSGMSALPWIAYFGRSISGSGYFGIIPIVNSLKHKEHFAALEAVFKSMGIILDKAPSNISSLRYQSFDENAYFNHHASKFAFVKESVKVANNSPYIIQAKKSTNSNPFHDYNINGNVPDLLLSKGWTLAGNGKEGQLRFTRPGKKNGVSADWHPGRRTLFVFSSDPATGVDEPMKGYSPASVFCSLEGCSSNKQCAKKLFDLGYGNPQN